MSGTIPPLPVYLHSVQRHNFAFYPYQKRHNCGDKLKRGEVEGRCGTVGGMKTEHEKFRPGSSRKLT
jgi:hypothetical protein